MQPKSLASIFLSDETTGEPSTLSSPQIPSSPLHPVLPGDTRLLFPALHSPSQALWSHTPRSCRGLWATFLRGLQPSPAGEREERCRPKGMGKQQGGRSWGVRNHVVEIKMNTGQKLESSATGQGEGKQSYTVMLYGIRQQDI